MRSRTVVIKTRKVATGTSRAGPMLVARLVQTLETLASGREALAFSDLGRMLGVPKSSLNGFLREMERLQLVDRDAKGMYRQGPGACRLGLQLLAAGSLAETIRHWLSTAGRQLQMTATLGRLDFGLRSLVYVDRWQVPEPVKFIGTLGQPLDLHCRAIGKLLLAYEPEETWSSWLGPEPYRSLTIHTRTTLAALTGDLRRTRACEVAETVNEAFVGVTSIAVPVRGADGRVLGAFGAQASSERVAAKRAEVVQSLRRYAGALGDDLAARGIVSQSFSNHI